MKRLFFALPLPKLVEDQILPVYLKLKQTMGEAEGLRYSAPEKWHITLLFMGRQTDQVLGELKASTPFFMQKQKAFDVNVQGAHTFSRQDGSFVLSLGVHSPQLRELQAQIVNYAKSLRLQFVAEASFVPHITLLRRGKGPVPESNRQIKMGLSCLNALAPLRFVADQVNLYESELLPVGSRYSVLSSWKLPA